MALQEKILYANNARSTLASGISEVDTSLSVEAGHGTRFPNPAAGECFLITVRDAAGNVERMKCTSRSGDVFQNLTRAIDGTTAKNFSAGAKVEVRLGKLELEQFVTQAGRNVFAVAGGTPNAITATFSPAFAALIDGMEVRVRAPGPNTGAVTFNPDGLGAKAVVRWNDVALVAGDIPAAGYELILRYSATLDKWVLLNPSPLSALNVSGDRWTTGDVKLTLKTVADPGWVMMDDGSIGNATSGATTRANDDCEALFKLLWDNIDNAWCPVQDSAGNAVARGASAQEDWDASRRIVLPKVLGRALAVAGTGGGLSARALGEVLGEEAHALTEAENGPHTHTMQSAGAHTHGLYEGAIIFRDEGTGSSSGSARATRNSTQSAGAHTHTIDSSGSGTPHNNMQPTAFLNVMIRL
jgi:microcystin-dependent protein